jgi:hypothetical protein
MKRLVFVMVSAISVLASCNTPGPSVDHQTLGKLGYSTPQGWQSKDQSLPRRPIIVWTPSDRNDGKESVTVMRTEELPALTKAGTGYIQRYLNEAQKGLPQGKFSEPVSFTSKYGFVGVRIEGEFVPPGSKQKYRRIHAVLIDGNSLIHVMATGVAVDRDAFEIVIDSLVRREA